MGSQRYQQLCPITVGAVSPRTLRFGGTINERYNAANVPKFEESPLIGRLPTVLSFVLLCICSQTRLAGEEQSREVRSDTSHSAIVGKVSVTQRPKGLTIEIAVSAPVVPTSDRLTNPDRLVFDFPGCELEGANRHIPVNIGLVGELRISLFRVQPPVTRVVVASKSPVDFQVKPSGNAVVIEITFPNAVPDTAASTRQAPSVEGEHAATASIPERQPGRELAGRAAERQPSAYSLQAKAKALNIEDLQALEDKAESGDPGSQTTLALAYHAGVLLKRDDAEALRLLHKAADHGFMAAQESMGIFSEMGIGLEQPAPAEALDWYKKAARQGSVDAATNIALMYADGRGVPRDPAQALSWFRQAAEGGDSAAQYNLALIYERGDAIPPDKKESIRWRTAAADQNVLPAILDLARIYMHPPDSTPPDINRAIHYYEKAADLGSGIADAILGTIFANGMQGKPDYDQSVKWYRKAAEQGQPDGEFGLGLRYALGQGVPLDLEEARRLFTAAADQGQVDAQYDLAIVYEEGKGTPADQSLAEHFYQLAANQGMPKAQFRLGRLLASKQQSRSDRVSAYKWLMLAQDSIKESSAVLSDLRKSMNEQEITEAEREVDTWRLAQRGTRR